MIETITNYITNFEFNSHLGILLYWIPLIVCAIGYTMRTWANVQKDLNQREKAEEDELINQSLPQEDRRRHIQAFYHPKETIGHVLGRIFVSVMPVVSLISDRA